MRTEDGHIIQKCLDGDTAAFGLLVDKYKGSVYALAYAKLGNFHDAQDITQEVFLKAFRKLRTLKRWDRFLSWLYAITSNLCKDFLRSKASRPDGEYVADQEVERLDHISIDSHHEDQIHQTLREALSELPEIHRQVLSLHYLGGLSCKEISQFLGVSPHAIAMRLNRARAKLRKEMLTMMHTSFDGQKLHSGFTLNIVEMIRRTHIQPNPQAPVIPIGIAAIGILTLSMLCLTAPFNQIPAIGKLVGAPIPSETKVMDVGEIPVDVVMLSKSSVVSSGDGKNDLVKNSRQTNDVQIQNSVAELESDSHNRPIARLGNGTIHRIAYSPDGRLFAAAGALGTWLYDAESFAKIGLLAGSAAPIAFNTNGQTLASGSWSDPSVHLWDLKSQEKVGGLPLSDQRGITALTYSPGGKILAVGYTRGDIALWDTETQTKTALIDTTAHVIWTLAFSPDGQMLASGGFEDSTISLWDVQTQALLGGLDGHTREARSAHLAVSSIAFSPDGKILASGSSMDCTLRLWDVASRAQIAVLLELDTEKDGEINSIAFSPDGTLLASASDDGVIRMWNTRTLKQVGELETKSGGVTSIAFRPDGKILAALNGRPAATARHRGGDMAIRIWEVQSHKQIAELGSHSASVDSVAVSPDNRLFAAGRQDGAVELWDLGTREQIDVLRGHDATVQCVVFSPDGRFLASSAKEHARLWNIEDREEIGTFKHSAIVESVAFSPDSKTLACVDDNCIRLWDIHRKTEISVLGEAPLVAEAIIERTGFFNFLTRLINWLNNWIFGKPAPNLPVHYVSIIQSIAFSPDGKLLVSGGLDNTVRLWDVGGRRQIFSRGQDQNGVDFGNILSVAFSPTGKVIASAGRQNGIHLWSETEHSSIGILNTEEYVETLAFHPDGRFLAAGVRGKVNVWSMETQEEVAALEGCLGAVKAIAFSSDGNTLVGSAGRGVIRVWDTSGLGNE